MLVFVLNKEGRPLMPCSPPKARRLLKEGKAKVVKRTPFTIQLKFGSSGYTQKVSLGVDSGYTHVGLSATTEKKEVYAAQVDLRTDIVKLNAERLAYRRTRRNRKTWYRKPRFLNRVKTKKKGWFAPSLRNKIDTHLKVIENVGKILPISKVCVEVANFNIQKIKNPEISGEGYQQGDQLGFWNVREYVLYRDGHKCQCCKGKSKDRVLNVHHKVSRQIGGDRPDNLVTLCETCHHLYHQGKVDFKVKVSKGFKAETFMTAVRWQIINRLKSIFGEDVVSHTYGYKTKCKRIENKISKSHINDAFVISGGTTQERSQAYLIKQVRKCSRKLFKGIRSHIKNTAPEYLKGFKRFDKVLFKGREVFIFGRRATGYFDLRLLTGEKIHASTNFKKLRLLERATSLLISEIFCQRAPPFLPMPKGRGFSEVSDE